MESGKETEIFNNFLSESAELLGELEQDVIILESNPSNRETIDNIFRCVHSLKGNSSLFGLSGVKLFTHTLENLLMRIRENQMEADSNVIGVILRGADMLRVIFGRLTNDPESTSLNSDEERYINEITAIMEGKEGGSDPYQKLRAELMKFINAQEVREELKTNETLRNLYNLISSHAPELVKDRRGTKGDPLFFDGVNVSREYYTIKSIIEEVKKGNYSETHSANVFGSLQALIGQHEQLENKEPLPLLTDLVEELEMIYQDETGFDEILAEVTEQAMTQYDKFLKKAKPEKTGKQAAAHEPGKAKQQIRVDQEKLDKALDTVGEMVTISEFFNYLLTQFNEGKVEKNINSLKDAVIALQELNESLSRDLYDIRKVPVQEVFQKLPRVVRDTQVAIGKKTRLVINGEETMVDKSLVAKLETILVHMLRNSIDHGIEHPDDRVMADKPEEGTITLSVKGDDTWISITVADDGRGIDLEKLKAKALAKGFMDEKEAETISDKALAEKILTPGFSTAENVSETSGRGVGMDIVYSYIVDMGGKFAIDNNPGKGLAITLKIPVTQTTLVKKGLAVSVGGNAFLIPIETVLESFRPTDGEVHTVSGRGEVIQRRGEIISLVRLHELFELKTTVHDPMEGLLVMVQYKGKKICFMVDYVIGQRQIIYKQLSITTLKRPSPFEGVSVYDGSRLAMILDVSGIIGQIEQT